ncbi:helix-turn-helix domain-containing protein [Bifidobacterium sp. SO4]|uniref:helix-turn-helix transcriptional regulator n=1 Tax=Bifidobacterium sp. SO4 TaxID=2809030 RepID=UPI001BDCC0AB|nr:helix-turn-helix domain-containing protein [Bifidobacterium sp. SO4]MBT1171360.1 helix-turn-helix domain-containing protein [Bifidobacterium sp. SO4]
MNGGTIQIKPLWTADDLAKRLGISKSTIFRNRCYHPESMPPSVKIGKQVRWRPEDVEQWITERVGGEE